MAMEESSAQRWARYWSDGDADGEVFTRGGTSGHPALEAFWRDRLAKVSGPSLDVACGAATVFQHGSQAGIAVALDYSHSALGKLRERTRTVLTLVGDAAELPFSDASMAQVVSQFGLEYAGMPAFGEAARVLAPDGNLVLLCHLVGSKIFHQSDAELQALDEMAELEFLPRGEAALRAAYAGDEDAFVAAARSFMAAERPMAERLQGGDGSGLPAHLYRSFRALFEERARYAPEDAFAWLSASAEQMAESRARLRAIIQAALPAEDQSAVLSSLAAGGVRDLLATPFYLPGDERPLAVVIEGRGG